MSAETLPRAEPGVVIPFERRPTVMETQAPFGGFTQIKNALILNTDLHPMARFLLVVLREHRNEQTGLCKPAYDRLCELCGGGGHKAAPVSLQGWLRALAEAGEVAWAKDGRSNRYLFPGDPGFEDARQANLTAQPRKLTRRPKAAPEETETTSPSEVIAPEPETTSLAENQHFTRRSAALH